MTGSILRIDVDRTQDSLAYGIPADNPFRKRPGKRQPTQLAKAREEIWAYGLRMPWRFSWDSKTGDLWVGDIGQNLFENVRIVRNGENQLAKCVRARQLDTSPRGGHKLKQPSVVDLVQALESQTQGFNFDSATNVEIATHSLMSSLEPTSVDVSAGPSKHGKNVKFAQPNSSKPSSRTC